MLIPILVAIIGILAVGFALIYAVTAAFRSFESRLYESITAFLTSPGKDQPAPVESYAQLFANKIVTSFSGSFMGVRSGLAKEARILENEAKENMISQSPVLSVAQQFMPKLSKSSPLMLTLIEQIGGAFAAKALKSTAWEGNGNHQAASTKLNLNL